MRFASFDTKEVKKRKKFQVFRPATGFEERLVSWRISSRVVAALGAAPSLRHKLSRVAGTLLSHVCVAMESDTSSSDMN